ncbi:MAG: hypothetical protein WCI85_14270 [Comamonadaceae bacterium]
MSAEHLEPFDSTPPGPPPSSASAFDDGSALLLDAYAARVFLCDAPSIVPQDALPLGI